MTDWSTRGPLSWNEPAPDLEGGTEGRIGERLVLSQLTKRGWTAERERRVPGFDLIAYRPEARGFVTIEVKRPPRRGQHTWRVEPRGPRSDRDFTIFVEPGDSESPATFWIIPANETGKGAQIAEL